MYIYISKDHVGTCALGALRGPGAHRLLRGCEQLLGGAPPGAASAPPDGLGDPPLGAALSEGLLLRGPRGGLPGGHPTAARWVGAVGERLEGKGRRDATDATDARSERAIGYRLYLL